jgi:hypothetical protein
MVSDLSLHEARVFVGLLNVTVFVLHSYGNFGQTESQNAKYVLQNSIRTAIFMAYNYYSPYRQVTTFRSDIRNPKRE